MSAITEDGFVIGNMIMNIDENTDGGEKEELEMLTVQDLSNNGLFSEKLLAPLDKASIQSTNNEDQEYSSSRECEDDSDIDEYEADESIDIENNTSLIKSDSKDNLSSLYFNSDVEKKRKLSREEDIGNHEDNGINQFNEILARRLSRKKKISEKKKKIHNDVYDEVHEKENYGYVSKNTSNPYSSVLEDYRIKSKESSDNVNRCEPNFLAGIESTNSSGGSVEMGSESPLSNLQEITIMKEEMMDNFSDSEVIADNTHYQEDFNKTTMMKISRKERIDGMLRRKRPVIHRKCKINGKKDVGKNFKSKFISRCLMKYKSNMGSSHVQKFVTFQCEKCEYSTNNRSNYKNHLLIHGDERLYQCPFCPYKSKQSAGLRAHYKVHSVEKPFTCSFCQYKSKRKQNLVQHLKIHAKEKPFRCDECSFQGSTKQLLQNHVLWHITRNQKKLRKHSETGNYECFLCSVIFPTEEDLSSHYESHADENDVSSTQEVGTLNKEIHRKLEKANIAFKCSQCDFVTLRKCAFRNHVKSHEKSIQKCDFCNYKCDLPSKLSAHMESHNINRSIIECPYCDFEAFSEVELNSHLDENHRPINEMTIKSLDIEQKSNMLSKRNCFQYNCPFCRFTCFIGEILKVHICNHSNDDLKIYGLTDTRNSNDLDSRNMSNILERDPGVIEKVHNNTNPLNDSQDVNGAETISEYQLRNDGFNMPSKRSFNGELINPMDSSRNSVSNDRQSSYSTYCNNYELMSESGYGEYEAKFDPMLKKFKTCREDVHNNTMHDNKCNCSSSPDYVNDEIDYENIHVGEVLNMNPTINTEAFPGNDAYLKTDVDQPYIGMLASTDTQHQFEIPSSSTLQYPAKELEGDMNNESFRILLHVLENTNLDYKSKASPSLNSMRNDDSYSKFIHANNIPKQDIFKTCNFPITASYNSMPNYAFSRTEDNKFPTKVNESNAIAENFSETILSEIQKGANHFEKSWKPTVSNLPEMHPPVNEFLINNDLDGLSLNYNTGNSFQHIGEAEIVTNDIEYRNGTSSVDMIELPPSERNCNDSSPRRSHENNMKDVHLTPKGLQEGFDKKFERYALSNQNRMDTIYSSDQESTDYPVSDNIVQPSTSYTNECQSNESGNENDNNNYSCHKCDVTYTNKCSLSNHNRIHVSSKNLHCSSCSYETKYRKALLAHTKKHLKQSSFRCVQCDFSTKRKCSLISHYRSHTQLYICSHCGYQCRLLRELEVHSVIHEEGISIKCMFCDFTSPKHKMLKHHMKKHTSNPLYKCTRCSFGFQTEQEFHCHLDAHELLDKQKYPGEEDKPVANLSKTIQ